MTAEAAPDADPRTGGVEGLVVATGVLVLGIALCAGALAFEAGRGYQVVGPQVFPLIVGAVATICGLILTAGAVRALLRGRAHRPAAERPADEPGTPTNRKNVALLAILLFGYAAALVPVGFWQSTGLVYACAARIFGSRRWVRDILIGYALAFAAYFLFDRLLAVGLPDGYFRIAG